MQAQEAQEVGGRTLRAGVLAALAAAMLLPAYAGAATIPVSIHDDTSIEDDECSLREAVTAVNTNAPVEPGGAGDDCPGGDPGGLLDTITLDATGAGPYQLAGGAEDSNVSGDLDFTAADAGGVEIEGDVSGEVLEDTIDGGDTDRVLDFIAAAPATLTAVRVQNGATAAAGGGIRAQSGALAITASAVNGSDSGAEGGGIAKGSGGQLTITDTELIGNLVTAATDAQGGAVSSYAPTVVEDSVIATNVITGPANAIGGDEYRGGGVAVSGASAAITGSVLDSNAAIGGDIDDQSEGGGIWIDGTTLTLEESTLFSNDAHAGTEGLARGAGVFTGAGGSFKSVNSTISENVAFADFSLGGGVFSEGAASATLVQTTMAENEASDFGPGLVGNATIRGTIIDQGAMGCDGDVTANAYNLDAGTSCVGAAPDTDLANADPMLGALTDYVYVPDLAASDAVDAVPEQFCDDLIGLPLTVDQRGDPRPREGDGNGVPECEAGAIELQESRPPLPPASAPAIPVSTPTAGTPTSSAPKKCRKGFKLKKGKCKRKKRRR